MATRKIASRRIQCKRDAGAVNERGRRIGESHPRAKLTDHEVDLIRELIEDELASGKRPLEAYRAVAARFAA